MTTIVIITAFLALVSGIGIGASAMSIYNRYQVTIKENAALKEQVEWLQGKHKCNPHNTNAGLENTMAILYDAKQQAEIANERVREAYRLADYTQTRLADALEDLKQIRSDPDHYDPNKPSKKQEQAL